MRNNYLSAEAVINAIASLCVAGGIFLVSITWILLVGDKSEAFMAFGLKGMALGLGVAIYRWIDMRFWLAPCLFALLGVGLWLMGKWPPEPQSLLNPNPYAMILIEGTAGAFLVKGLTSATERLVPVVLRFWPF